jgi:hypothetical protein
MSNAPSGFLATHSIRAKRLMSDNAYAYMNNRSRRKLLTRQHIRRQDTYHLLDEDRRSRSPRAAMCSALRCRQRGSHA